MKFRFSKFSGSGNDFILIDDRAPFFPIESKKTITKLCHRQEGIGADGLILLHSSERAACKMRIFNADGSEAEMCGNGLRCLVRFAASLGIDTSQVESMHSLHHTIVKEDRISIEMSEPTCVEWDIDLELPDTTLRMHALDTGVPHAVLFVQDCQALDMATLGFAVRHHPRFAPKGINFNGAQLDKNTLIVRTYERGVEAETLACGTGVTASALAAAKKFKLTSPLAVQVRSGDFLRVDFKEIHTGFTDIWLSGPAQKIFDGEILIEEKSLC